MANTLTTMQGLLFAEGAISKFNDVLFPLRAITFGASPKPAQRGNIVTVPTFPTASAGAYSGDYSASDVTITGTQVTLNQHSFVSFGFTDREVAESGIAPEEYYRRMGAQAGRAVASTVCQYVMGLITAASYGNAAGDKLVVAASAFTADSVATIRGKLVAKKIPAPEAALVMGSDYWTSLLKDTTLSNAAAFGGAEAIRSGAIPSLFGLNGVYESTVIPTNSENLAGFACAPQALAAAIRYLEPQSDVALVDSGMVSDETTGVTLGIRIIPDQLHGKLHYAVECLYGAIKLDGAALVRILSA